MTETYHSHHTLQCQVKTLSISLSFIRFRSVEHLTHRGKIGQLGGDKDYHLVTNFLGETLKQ